MRIALRDERGNIYIEAIVAVAILALGLLPIFGGWSLTAAARGQVGQQETALALARSELEPLHALSGAAWDALPATASRQSDGYTIARTVALRPDLAGLKNVTVTVTWVDRKGKTQSVALTSAVARRP